MSANLSLVILRFWRSSLYDKSQNDGCNVGSWVSHGGKSPDEGRVWPYPSRGRGITRTDKKTGPCKRTHQLAYVSKKKEDLLYISFLPKCFKCNVSGVGKVPLQESFQGFHNFCTAGSSIQLDITSLYVYSTTAVH